MPPSAPRVPAVEKVVVKEADLLNLLRLEYELPEQAHLFDTTWNRHSRTFVFQVAPGPREETR